MEKEKTLTNAKKENKPQPDPNITKNQIKNHYTIIKNSWQNGVVLPYELIHPRAYFLTNYNLDINVKKVDGYKVTRNGRKFYIELWKYLIYLLTTVIRKKCFLPDNINVYTTRLRMHYNKYGTYKPEFRKLMSTQKAIYGGIVIQTSKPFDTLQERRFKKWTETTTQNTMLEWLQNGSIVIIPPEQQSAQNSVKTYDSFEVYDDIDPQEAKKLIPLLGFGDIIWTSQTSDQSTNVSDDKTLDWYFAWNNCLRTKQRTVDTGFRPREWEARQWHVRATTTGKTIEYTLMVLVSKALVNKLFQTSYTKLMLSKDGWMVNDQLHPIEHDEFRTALTALSLASKPQTLYRLSATEDTVFSITCGTKLSKSDVYIEICKAEMAKIPTDEISKILLIAGKGVGKTTFINVLKNTTAYDTMFIEDSDDWGEWLSFLMHKYENDDLKTISQGLSEQAAMDSVVEFYVNKHQKGMLHRSHLNLKAISTVRAVLIELGAEGTKSNKVDLQMMQLVISKIKPALREYIVELNNLTPLTQKTFEDGIHTYMQMFGKRIYVSFLHTYLDNAKRRNQTLAVKFETGTNSIVNLSLRAMKNDYNTCEYIADVMLQDIFNNASDLCLTKLTANQVLQLFGVVPVLDENFRLKLLRDVGERGVN